VNRVVSARITGWAPALRHLVTVTDPATVAPVSLRSMPPLTAWVPSDVTLLGDAIHNMTPMAGVGANTALRDADELRQALLLPGRGISPPGSAATRRECAARPTRRWPCPPATPRPPGACRGSPSARCCVSPRPSCPPNGGYSVPRRPRPPAETARRDCPGQSGCGRAEVVGVPGCQSRPLGAGAPVSAELLTAGPERLRPAERRVLPGLLPAVPKGTLDARVPRKSRSAPRWKPIVRNALPGRQTCARRPG
jgi:hypothetical protein